MATADAVLERISATLDPAWIGAQRWFRAKRRTIAAVATHDLVGLPDGKSWLAVLRVDYQDGGSDRYLVPLAMSGQGSGEPADGDGTWRTIAAAIVDGTELSGRRGTFVMEAAAAAERLVPGGGASLAGRPERRLRVEQSNTSAVLDERLMLKLYRLLEPGVNPETEVGTFLTEVGFDHAPRVAGAATYLPDDDVSCAVAMLGEFVSSQGDGWAWALDRLADPGAEREVLAGVAGIGSVTAELHAALASRPDDPAFPARPATTAEQRAMRTSAEQQLAAARGALVGADRERLARMTAAIERRIGALGETEGAQLSRIHGDYHLGQLLRTADGFVVVDFEGEPARSLAERRLPASPLRDVAGMLRSLDYAARTAERSAPGSIDPDAWVAQARQAFLAGYRALSPDEVVLLGAFEVEKACYEVRYEANNRPDWTWLPIAALERLAA